MGGLRTFMAPLGQNSWQQKQRMQAARWITGFSRFMVIALAGQMPSHFRQPTQASFSTPGRAASARDRNLLYSSPRLPPPMAF